METHGEMRVSKFKTVCVFCGSSPGKKSSYQDAAIELGNELVYFNIQALNCISMFLFCFCSIQNTPFVLLGFNICCFTESSKKVPFFYLISEMELVKLCEMTC